MSSSELFITVKVNTKAIAEDVRILTEGGVKLSEESINEIVEEHIEVIR
jgi:hypothetical protein